MRGTAAVRAAARRPTASQRRQLGPSDLRADRVDVVAQPANDRLIADDAEYPAVLFHEDPPNPFFGHDCRDSIDPFARIDVDEGTGHQFLEADLRRVSPRCDDLGDDVPLGDDADRPSLGRRHDDEPVVAVRHRLRGFEKGRVGSPREETGLEDVLREQDHWGRYRARGVYAFTRRPRRPRPSGAGWRPESPRSG